MMLGTGPGLGHPSFPRSLPWGWGPGSPFPRDHVAAAQLHCSRAGRRGVPPRCVFSISSL